MHVPFELRPEAPSDAQAIHEIHALAFGRPDEADLVRRLRAEAAGYAGFVAAREGRVAAHAAFSAVAVGDAPPSARTLGLAPMAVTPALQRTGVGSALVRFALGALAKRGAELVFVLGHAEYYPRFGFEPAAARGFGYRDPGFDAHFFVLELAPGAAAGRRGAVRFDGAFDAL